MDANLPDGRLTAFIYLGIGGHIIYYHGHL